MNKKIFFSLLVLASAPTLLMAVDEARLLRFPTTNNKEIVFSYGGDLYQRFSDKLFRKHPIFFSHRCA